VKSYGVVTSHTSPTPSGCLWLMLPAGSVTLINSECGPAGGVAAGGGAAPTLLGLVKQVSLPKNQDLRRRRAGIERRPGRRVRFPSVAGEVRLLAVVGGDCSPNSRLPVLLPSSAGSPTQEEKPSTPAPRLGLARRPALSCLTAQGSSQAATIESDVLEIVAKLSTIYGSLSTSTR